MYLDLPIIFAVLQIWPRFRPYCTGVGLFIMCLALALSSFATTTTHLIASQGIFYAIGGSLAYSPCIIYMDEWFVKRKGLAFGIMWVCVLGFFDILKLYLTASLYRQARASQELFYHLLCKFSLRSMDTNSPSELGRLFCLSSRLPYSTL